jgi:hypothetical protein
MIDCVFFTAMGSALSSFLEIVELVNGDIVLQRADGDGEALMTIRFSDESKTYMPNGRLEVARAMIHAGIETASQMQFVKSDLEDEDRDLESPRILH